MNHTIRGQYTLCIPEEEGETLKLTLFDKCGNPGQTIDLHPATVEAIYRWRQDQYDLEDVDFYIDNVERGDESPQSGMTAEKLKAIRVELRDLYQGARDDSGNWIEYIRAAVQQYEWDHRETKTYWKCPRDQYGQRTGDVIEVQMAEWQYNERSKHEFLYDSYEAALAAAQD